MIFQNKTILIISSQNWDSIKISKQHYAISLRNSGNTVFFLEPLQTSAAKQSIVIKEISGEKNIFKISVSTAIPHFLRFKFRWLYNCFIKFLIDKIIRKMNGTIDIVWCFDPNLYSNLRIFKAKITIYHPVDLISKAYQFKPAKTADLVLSVSRPQIAHLKKYNTHSFFINHGLNEIFSNKAMEYRNNLTYNPPTKIKIGYYGNLLIHCIDLEALEKMIKEFNHCEFHFWGPDEITENKKNTQMLWGIKNYPHCFFHGVKEPMELVEEISMIDIFLVIYKYFPPLYDLSNSHKILEYLSTGKVIVSSKIEAYKEYPELIRMPETQSNERLSVILGETIHDIFTYNAPELQKKRVSLSLENTYIKQIEKISNILMSLN